METKLVDLDFDVTTNTPSSQEMPLSVEPLIGYQSPNSNRKNSKSNNKNNSNNKSNSNNNTGGDTLFEDLGIQDFSEIEKTTKIKPNSGLSSDVVIDFSSPPAPKKNIK
eukprot:gene5057-6296_t